MVKVALISSLGTSDWISCQSISNNLVKSCELISDVSFEKIFINDSMLDVDCWDAARRIVNSRFDKIFFIEHSPHPGLLLRLINEIDPNYKPELLIYAYGDFVLYIQKWGEISTLLSTFKVRFVVASNKQKKLLAKMILNEENLIDVVSFPVDETKFYYNPQLRTELRQKNNILNNEKIIFYSGRLSSQKNIIELLQIFDVVDKNFFTNSTLYIAGPVDDIGLPYFGKKGAVGYYNYNIQQMIKKLFQNERINRVVYLGNLTAQKLFEQYQMSDLYISLSTHHDEDYGMAPAEALMCGLPVILSQWGGYADFLRTFKEDSYSVKTIFTEMKASVDSNLAIKTLAYALSDMPKDRSKIALKANENLSIRSTSIKISEIIKSKKSVNFLGFTDLFQNVVQLFKVDPLAPFGKGPKATKIYQDIYFEYGN